MKFLEIMDTTLRDGEQMQNVSYTTEEKLTITQILLTEVKVDRLELTSARTSEGEKETVKKVTDWAKANNLIDKIEILSFVDYNRSVDWAESVGIKNLNLLVKGSLKHCETQLKKSLDEHLIDIKKTVDYAVTKGMTINVYLEDFSNGILDSEDYVYNLIDKLITMPVKRIMLPDTLGIFNHFQCYEQLKKVIEKYPDTHFDFHPHNDYGLGVANALSAIKAGIKGIHTTVNGMGERAGNASLDEVVVGINDFMDVDIKIDEKKLYRISQHVEMFSGHRMAGNKPIYGKNVFIQTAGIHADGDKKGNLYANRLIPERFGRKREYALGKLAGKANLDINLKKLEIELSDDKKKILLNKIIELGDKKKNITAEDLPFLISDIFDFPDQRPFTLLYCTINSSHELKPVASIKVSYSDNHYDSYAHGDGGYDAFMNAIKKILKELDISIPKLVDYSVSIPPGGKTDALVQAIITWEIECSSGNKKTMITRGVNSDQNFAAIEATIKIINYILIN